MKVDKRLMSIVIATILFASQLATKNFGSHAPVKTITVSEAINRAATMLRGPQIDRAIKYINERSQGGTIIAENIIDSIVERVLVELPLARPLAKKEDADLKKAIQESLKNQSKDQENEEINALLARLNLQPTAAGKGDTKIQKDADDLAQAIKQSLNPSQSNLPLVPAGLAGKVTYIPTVMQTNNECGSRAAFAAKILSQLPNVENMGVKTISEHINEGIKKFDAAKKVCYYIIYDSKVLELAHKENIKNFYIMQYGKIGESFLPLILQRTSNSYANINTMYNVLKNSPKREEAYFIFNTGDPLKGGYHWVLAAVIKPIGKKPKIFYLDSLNDPIKPGSFIYKTLHKLTQDLGL